MSIATENTLREKQLQSNGRLLSSFSHELKNNLAIIIETNGLLQDYIDMGRIRDKDFCHKLSNILTQLNKRTGMTVQMAHNLNSFGHRFDSPSSTFDLNELLVEQLFFLRRSANLKKIVLNSHIPEGELSIYSFPSLIQFIFHRLFDVALDQLGEDDQLEISTNYHNNCIHIFLSLKSKLSIPPSFTSARYRPDIQLCLKKIGADIDIDFIDNKTVTILLSLPRSQ